MCQRMTQGAIEVELQYVPVSAGTVEHMELELCHRTSIWSVELIQHHQGRIDSSASNGSEPTLQVLF